MDTELDAGDAPLAELLKELDPSRLRALINTRLGELCGCEATALYTLSSAERRYAPVEAIRDGREPPVFAARGALARWLRVNAVPLVLPDDRDVLGYLPSDERAALERAGVRVCLPWVARGQLLGFVPLCRPNRPVPRLDDRLDLLRRVAEHAALVFDRAAHSDAERERQKAVSRVQQLAAAGQLAAAMAHEIRNPLAAIRSGVQFVAEVDRINRVISNVLGFSRPRDLSLAEQVSRRSGPHARRTLLPPPSDSRRAGGAGYPRRRQCRPE